MPTGNHPEFAQKNGVARTIPSAVATESVTASEGSFDLTPYAGQWIFLRSAGADITVLRAASTPTLVAGVGHLVGAVAEEHYVDPGGAMTMFHISSGAVDLYVLSDPEQR